MKTSRHSLLGIGREIVCKQGFGGLSFGALALRAGIRKASVHHHFPAKADFGAALIALETEALTSALAAAEGDTRRGYLAMREFLRERREQSGGGTALDLLTSLSADASTLEKESRTALASARELVVRRVAAILQTGRRDRTIAVAGDIEEEARAVLSQVEGAQIAARAAGDIAVFDRTLATLEKRTAAH